MSARAFRLLVLLFSFVLPVSFSPVLAASDAQPQGGPVAQPDAMKGWASGVRSRVLRAAIDARQKQTKGGLVKLSFTVTETGRLVDIRAEGDPRAAARITAALAKVGEVPAPPDGSSHPVTIGVRIVK